MALAGGARGPALLEQGVPIDKALRARCYNTKTWREQRERIVHGRAARRCECRGECYRHEGVRCPERHGQPGVLMRTLRVVLQLVHLDRKKTGELVPDDELKAMCPGCHLRYDQAEHISNARRRRWRELDARARAAGQLSWLDDDEETPD